MRLQRKHKYGAKRTTVDGVTFASMKEARRYTELKLLRDAGELTHLELQPAFPLWVHSNVHQRALPVKIGTYRADFRYRDKSGASVVEDVKSEGTKTTAYRLKKRFVEAQYGILIREV